MCLTCGCMDAHLDMGEANIRYEDVERAAKERGVVFVGEVERGLVRRADERLAFADGQRGGRCRSRR